MTMRRECLPALIQVSPMNTGRPDRTDLAKPAAARDHRPRLFKSEPRFLEAQSLALEKPPHRQMRHDYVAGGRDVL